jgi:ribosomal protein L3 glutamine methyltransferase
MDFENSDIFFGHGTFNAFDEAVWLVSSTLNIPFSSINSDLERVITDADIKKIDQLKSIRINQKIPLAYILKEAWLKGYNFYVDERVIIPRSIIADLIDEDFYPWIESMTRTESVLDLCCGSGCLGILMSLNYKNIQVDVADISDSAIAVAKINIKKYNLEQKVTAIHTDLFSNIKNKKYDLIVTNPPYVNAKSMQDLPAEYQKEPKLALASGEDGLDLTRKIITESKSYLNDGGKIFIEIGHNRDRVDEVFKDLNIWWVDTGSSSDYIFMINKEDLPN